MLYFLVKGYIFTKKGTDTGTKVYSHSTTLIRKNLRTNPPKIPHFTTTKQHSLTPLFQPKSHTILRLTTQSPHPTKKYHPTKCKVTFLQTIKFSALKPSTTTSYLKSHNLYILKTYICHYTLRGIISTNNQTTIPVQVQLSTRIQIVKQ